MSATALVRQRTGSDCAICCVAMVTGKSYEDVLLAAGQNYDPEKGTKREYEILKALGYHQQFNGEKEPGGDVLCMYRGWGLGPELFRRMIWGRRALVSVPSLNIDDGYHMVYWDGERVWDPSQGKTYAAVEQLEPREVVLFNETRPCP